MRIRTHNLVPVLLEFWFLRNVKCLHLYHSKTVIIKITIVIKYISFFTIHFDGFHITVKRGVWEREEVMIAALWRVRMSYYSLSLLCNIAACKSSHWQQRVSKYSLFLTKHRQLMITWKRADAYCTVLHWVAKKVCYS